MKIHTEKREPIKLKGYRGQLLWFTGNPFLEPEENCYRYESDGLLIIEDDRIKDAGSYDEMIARYPGTMIAADHSGSLIMPGFVDMHLHYVQAPMIGSFGDTLLHWLNQYTFPTEARFSEKEYADRAARMAMRQLLSHGTTTANVFSTTFATSVDAFFEESERFGTRMITGKVLQDRNLPDNLRDNSAEESVETARELMNKWHERGRQLYAIIPRFAPTSSPLQLKLAGQLYQENQSRGVYMHTHLGECESEIRWVAELFPEADNYTDVYRRFNLLGTHSIMAHCCLLKPEEWKTIHDLGCGVAHCPSSNLFLGDGEFRFWECADPAHPCRFGMATDVGGGTSFSILRQIGEAYKVGMLQDRPLSPLKAFFLATLGGAQALRLDDRIGSFTIGNEADFTVIDLHADEFIAYRLEQADTLQEKLSVIQTLGLDNFISHTYVAGRNVYTRDGEVRFRYHDDILL